MKIKFKLAMLSVSMLLICGLTFMGTAIPVAAATQATSVMTITQELQTDRQGNQSIVLLAKLTRQDGYPLSERTISFFETVNLYGTARISLGSAITSAVGLASLKYETRQAGQHSFTAVYSGDDVSTSSIVDATLDLSNIPHMAPLEAPTGMEVIGKYTLPMVGLVVLLVWALLLGTIISVIRGIRSQGRRAQQERIFPAL
jgi:hypothetical protein